MIILKANLKIDYDNSIKTIKSITLKDNTLHYTLNLHLQLSTIEVNDAFDPHSKNILFVPQVSNTSNDVFDAVKIIKEQDNNAELAARVVNNLFEVFTIYWVEQLLKKGLDIIGIRYWHNILSIVDNWEKHNSPTIIHKGTLYYFLTENYLMTGNRELAFIYLYEAFKDDISLGKLVPSLNHPEEAPSYLTATIRANKNNHMYYLVKDIRDKVEQYIAIFNKKFNRTFTMQEFDKKFLFNTDLSTVVYFFVFNFLYLFELERYPRGIIENDFSRLKTLDITFNLCLIVDETLKEAYSKSKGHSNQYIHEGILWLCDSRGWMKSNDLQTFWKQSSLGRVASDDPDAIIPKLLAETEKYNGNLVRPEVFTLLVAYKLRNYGGHNINQQKIFSISYKEIIERLIMALLLCIDVL